MTAAEYHAKVATFDQAQAQLAANRIQARIDQIPWNVNRAGKHYKKLLKEIYES